MAGIHLSNIGVWRGRIKAFRTLPIFNVSRQLRTPHAMLRRSREFKNSAACKPLPKKGVVREAATRPCAQNARSFSERNGGRVGPAAIGIGAAKGLPHPAILGHDSLILRWNRSAGMFDASPRLTRGGYRLHRPPFDWHRGKAARFRGAPDRRPAVFTARRLQILAKLPPLGRSGTSSRFRTGSFPSRREPAR